MTGLPRLLRGSIAQGIKNGIIFYMAGKIATKNNANFLDSTSIACSKLLFCIPSLTKLAVSTVALLMSKK